MNLNETIIKKSREFAQLKMAALRPSHGWDHAERVADTALRICAKERKADRFIVETASILHDIARHEEDESGGKICHAEAGSRIAYDFLVREGLDRERADHVRKCILTHRYRNEIHPESLEAKIVFDADKIDSLGAVGIGRAFLFSGEVGARLHNHDIDVTATEAYSREDTAYREFMVKLRFLKKSMLTRAGKKIARARHRYMKKFFRRLAGEIAGKS